MVETAQTETGHRRGFGTRLLVPILVGYAASLAAYSRLPVALDAPAFVPLRPFTAFMLPTATAITIALIHLVWARDFVRAADEAAAAACRAIGFRLTMFVMAIHVLAMANLGGATWLRPWAPRIVIVLFGALLIGVGNLLPQTRPNLVVGLRTRLTLESRSLWIRIHRVAGYTLVGVGAVLAFSGTFLSRPIIAVAINAALITGLVVFALSYRRDARLHG
jgi:immunity protein, SdpI family